MERVCRVPKGEGRIPLEISDLKELKNISDFNYLYNLYILISI